VKKPSAPRIVLALLCLIYLILYVNRVNISTAAPFIKADLKLSNTQMGLVFSAFALPYAMFQLIGDGSAINSDRVSRYRSVAWWLEYRPS